MEPLHNLLESIYNRTAGKRTKTALARYILSDIGWSQKETDYFQRCKNALEERVTLCHRAEIMRLWLFTDASDTYWSGIVTQIRLEDINSAYKQQRHEPLEFLTGRLNHTQMGWTVIEKEAYAIIDSLERMHWLAAGAPGFDLFTDHKKLVLIFDPLSIVPDLSQTAIRKLIRWAVAISMYNYTCIHIDGTDNVWADLLGRWADPSTVRQIVQVPELPSSSESEFTWPIAETIRSTPEQFEKDRMANLDLIGGMWTNTFDAIWIPDEASDLNLRDRKSVV